MMSDGWQRREFRYRWHLFPGLEPPGEAGTFLVVWRRLKLIKKIVHFSVSELMSNSNRMVLLHLNIKSFAPDFYRITVIQTSFITWLKSQQHILNLKYKNCWKPSWSSEIILTNITFRNIGSAFSVSTSLNWHMIKNTVKSSVRENKFQTCLTRGTLPAEERVSKFHNHGKTPSYETFADASIRKVVPKSYGSHLKGYRKEGPSSYWDWDRVSRSPSWNCRP